VAPLVWRRRYPLGVFVTVCAIGFAQWLVVGVGTAADLSILIALYTVATRCPRRVALLSAATAELGAFVASWQHNADVLRAVIFLTALVAAAFFLGTNIRTRREYLAALVERAQRLEHERDQQAEIAVAAERARIAREMHDVVAHSLAVMVTMADGAALKGRSDPERAVAAMHQVSETGRHALGETRRLVNVLRTSPGAGPLAPQPGLAQLEPLIEQVRATGLRGALTVRGQQFPVPEGAQLAAYRIVQEALTNTLKHARHATRADVSLWYHDAAIELDITDDGDPQPGARSEGGGHGLVGMRERAAMYEGSIAAGPRSGRGWSVRARLDVAHALV
jgi:signal transduction histidine kinase